jgi:hypothetical protein
LEDLVKRVLTLVLMLPAISSLVWQLGMAQDAPDPEQQDDLFAQYQALIMPGEEHKLLEKLAGTWNMEVKMWMEPGAEPLFITGASTHRMILGGRFLMTEAKSGEGLFAGETLGILGFDRRSGVYTTVGFDTYGTYYVTGAGPYDEETRTITMSGEDFDPVLNHTQVYDFVMRLVSDDEYISEVIFHDEAHTKGKGPFKMLEIKYTRQVTPADQAED